MGTRLRSRSVVLRSVPANVSVRAITDLCNSCVTVEAVVRSKTGDTVYLVLGTDDMVTRAVESLQGLSLGDWALHIELVGIDREMQMIGLLQMSVSDLESAVKQEVQVKADLPDFVKQFSKLSVADQHTLMLTLSSGATANPTGSPVGTGSPLSTGSPPFVTATPAPFVPAMAAPFVPAMATPFVTATPAPPQNIISAPLPRLSQFSGDPGTKDVCYQQWKCELLDISHDQVYSTHQISQCVRRSLRGTAADVLLHLGTDITVPAVIDKFDNIFGDVLPPEVLLEQFYTARQKAGELVATWACRLEDILAKLKARSPASCDADSSDMLRSKFWSGLASEKVKGALRHRYDGGAVYSDLLVAARIAELESPSPITLAASQKVNQQQQVESKMLSALETLTKQLSEVQQRLGRLESGGQARSQSSPNSSQNPSNNSSQNLSNNSSQNQRRFYGKCFKCREFGHRASECLNG
jgi:hypothetical protein